MAALVRSVDALERVVMVARTVRRSADEAMVGPNGGRRRPLMIQSSVLGGKGVLSDTKE